jgi:hypothetical protein
MTYAQALKLIHARRLEAVKLHGGQPDRAYTMSVAEREDLGARWLVLCASLGKVDPTNPLAYNITTVGGLFRTHYDPHFGTIFGRFERPREIHLLGVNGYSGKWNIHTDRDWTADGTIKYWERAIRSVLLEPKR